MLQHSFLQYFQFIYDSTEFRVVWKVSYCSALFCYLLHFFFSLPPSLSWNLGTLTSWNPLGHSRPVTALLYLFTLFFSCCHHIMLYYVSVFFVCSKIHLIWLLIVRNLWWFVTGGKIVLCLSMMKFCSLLITFSCTVWTMWRSSGYYNVLRRSQNECTMYCWQNEFLKTWHN
jgi:hypothetical protein